MNKRAVRLALRLWRHGCPPGHGKQGRGRDLLPRPAQGQACLQCGTAPAEAPARDPDAGAAAGAALPAAATAAARVTLRPSGGGGLLKLLRGGGDGAPAGARCRAGAAGAGAAGGPADPQAAEELRHALLELHETRELNEARLARCRTAVRPCRPAAVIRKDFAEQPCKQTH